MTRSRSRSAGRVHPRCARSAPLLAAFALLAVPAVLAAGRVAAQEPAREPDPERAEAIERADAIRDTLTQPPGAPPFDAIDALMLPLRIVAVPLDLLFKGIGWAAGRITRPGPPTLPVRVVRAVREWGAVPRITSFGQRSGVAFELDLVRFSPFFFSSGISIRGSQRHELGVELGGPEAGLTASYAFLRDAEPRFWGIGSGTSQEMESVFLRDQQRLGVSAAGRVGVLRLSGSAGYEDNRVDRGFGGNPDLHDVFDPLPFGVAERTEYARLEATAALDFTRQRAFQSRGVLFGAGGALFRGVDGTPSDFHRLEGEVIGYLPINPRQQLAVRSFAVVTRLDDGEGIPFFHLARVGGSTGLRGFSTDRFRDRDAFGLMAEWRYEIWRELHQRSRMEFFLFFDAAGVTGSLGDLSSEDLRESYGFGFRLVKLEGLVGYTSFGFGAEGFRWRLGDSWSF